MNQGSISVSDRAYVNKPSVNNFYVSSSKGQLYEVIVIQV